MSKAENRNIGNKENFMSKEDKFFEVLREFAKYISDAGVILNEVAEGRTDPAEGYKRVSEIKRICRDNYGRLTEKMYKTYKDPGDLDLARGMIDRGYSVVGILKDVFSRLDMIQVGEAPEELKLSARLISSSLEELKKTMDYTEDISRNYMKMEARCNRIYTYEERGDECFRSCMRKLFGGEDTKYLIYWKMIFEDLEEAQDAVAGMVPLLQKLITGM